MDCIGPCINPIQKKKKKILRKALDITPLRESLRQIFQKEKKKTSIKTQSSNKNELKYKLTV